VKRHTNAQVREAGHFFVGGGRGDRVFVPVFAAPRDCFPNPGQRDANGPAALGPRGPMLRGGDVFKTGYGGPRARPPQANRFLHPPQPIFVPFSGPPAGDGKCPRRREYGQELFFSKKATHLPSVHPGPDGGAFQGGLGEPQVSFSKGAGGEAGGGTVPRDLPGHPAVGSWGPPPPETPTGGGAGAGPPSLDVSPGGGGPPGGFFGNYFRGLPPWTTTRLFLGGPPKMGPAGPRFCRGFSPNRGGGRRGGPGGCENHFFFSPWLTSSGGLVLPPGHLGPCFFSPGRGISKKGGAGAGVCSFVFRGTRLNPTRGGKTGIGGARSRFSAKRSGRGGEKKRFRVGKTRFIPTSPFGGPGRFFFFFFSRGRGPALVFFPAGGGDWGAGFVEDRFFLKKGGHQGPCFIPGGGGDFFGPRGAVFLGDSRASGGGGGGKQRGPRGFFGAAIFFLTAQFSVYRFRKTIFRPPLPAGGPPGGGGTVLDFDVFFCLPIRSGKRV